MEKQVMAGKMRGIADLIKKEIPGLGFALLVFPFNKSGISNYISNAERQDMIKCLEETLLRFKTQQTFSTPESN